MMRNKELSSETLVQVGSTAL